MGDIADSYDCDYDIDYERSTKMKKEFHIAGVQFHEMKYVVNDLEEGMKLELVPEPDNKFDPNAIAIKHNDIMLGYVPKTHSAEVSAVMEISPLNCIIIAVDPSAKPWEQCKVIIQEVENG